MVTVFSLLVVVVLPAQAAPGGTEVHPVTGTIYVRVTDDDSIRGDSEADTVLVDLMYFSTAS